MNATDELRRMLDERGIETGHGSPVVWDCANGHAARATNYDGALTVQAVMTPEQAITATLGGGECRNKAKRPLTFWCDQCDCATEGWVDVGGTLINGFRYCPNCGARVVE